MQDYIMQEYKKTYIKQAIAKTVKRLRGNKSQFMLGAEFDIPSSVISDIERGVKDPQLTTLFKLANALNIKTSDFIKEIEKDLPENFKMFDD